MSKVERSTKPSGVPWLGEVPAHWEVKRLRFAVGKIGSGKTPKGGAESYATEGVVFIRSQNVYDDGLRLDDVVYIDEETDEDMAGTRVRPNDVLLNITGASIGRCAPVPDDLGPANVNQHVAIIRPERNKVDQRYLHAFLCSQATKAAILADEVGSSREALNFEQMAGLPILLPPLPEQRAIAAFLDERTARIDGLMARKKRLVQLLKERRQALVTRAVTRGLDPNVELKPSGVPWLGDVPVGWEVKRLKYISPAITVGIVVTPAKYYVDEGVPCLRTLNISGSRIDLTDLVFISQESNELLAKSQIRTGDILVARTGKTGAAVVVPSELHGVNCIDLLIIRKSDAVVSDYLHFYLTSSFAEAQIENLSVGTIQAHFNTSTLSELIIPLPPLHEQELMLASLHERTSRIDALISKVEAAVERLQEYRSALISAAVTGKVAVR